MLELLSTLATFVSQSDLSAGCTTAGASHGLDHAAKIMITDDSQSNVSLIAAHLSGQGYSNSGRNQRCHSGHCHARS